MCKSTSLLSPLCGYLDGKAAQHSVDGLLDGHFGIDVLVGHTKTRFLSAVRNPSRGFVGGSLENVYVHGKGGLWICLTRNNT